jgi:hypothetical protein
VLVLNAVAHAVLLLPEILLGTPGKLAIMNEYAFIPPFNEELQTVKHIIHVTVSQRLLENYN